MKLNIPLFLFRNSFFLGHAWSLRVPVDFDNDPDILFNELGNRLKRLSSKQSPSMPSTIDTPKEPLLATIDENIKGCGICGGSLVMIRGRYPNTDKREVCPTCATERLETINEISGRDYGKTYQDKHQ